MAWWLRRAGQRRATAILDSRCARCRGERQVGTKKTSLWVEQRNERLSGCQGRFLWWTVLPRLPASNHGVGEDEHLPGAGDKRALVFLSGRGQPLVKLDELLVPAKRCSQ